MMIVLTVGTAWLWHATGAWLPFVLGLIWTALFFWDLYFRFAVSPDTEISDEAYFDAHLSKWLAGNQDRSDKRLELLEKHNAELSSRMAKLAAELEAARKGDV